MQFINKLAAYGQALSRKQIAIVCGLLATASLGGIVLADYLSAPDGDALSDQVGAIQAEFKVNESGAATYNIKIYTPPGTAGVAPQVSLAYSSQGGNGVMGKGWSISGTSGISRCRASREAGDVVVDGNYRPVNFTSSDRFCLDGQRLLDVTSNTSNPTLESSCKVLAGATVMSLRTEIESFQRVCAYTFNTANGPRFFTVERKDGSTSWYGDRVTNSTGEIGARTDGFLESNRQLADGTYAANAIIANWMQTRFQDSTGNYIDYLYLKNPTQSGSNVTGELLLSEVKHTGKVVLPGQSGLASDPYASVKFNYNPTIQAVISYQSGARFTQSQRLISVTVKNENEVVRHYPLTYVNSVSGSSATLLKQIRECADVAATTCMQPTDFDWTTAVNAFATAAFNNTENWNNPVADLVDMKMGDVDGDGLADIVYVGKSGNLANTLYVSRAQSKNLGTMYSLFTSDIYWDRFIPNYYTSGGLGSEGWFLVDYNGDGNDDLALSNGSYTGNWVIRPSRGYNNGKLSFDAGVDLLAGLSTPIPSNGNTAEYQPKLSDLNGDGLMDIVYFKNDTIKARLMEKVNGKYGWHTERNIVAPDICTGIKSCAYVFDGLFRKKGFQQINDFNGDSRSDLLLYAKVTAAKDSGIFSTQGDMSAPPAPGISSTKSTKRISFSLTIDTITTTEIFLKRYSWWDPSTDSLGERVNFADINGDGLLDLVLNKSGFISSQINTGAGFKPEVAFGSKIYWYKKLQIVDINGDGRADIAYPDNISSRFKARYADINGTFLVEQEIAGGNAKTNCKIGSDTGDCLDDHIYQFGDFDADASIDFLRMRVKSPTGLEGSDAQTYFSKANVESRNTPRDVISQIQDGLGAKTKIDYLPLTNMDTYRRGIHCLFGCVWGRGSPVQDFMAPMYVAVGVAQSAPTAADLNATKSIFYRYEHARLQAGGRGLLGFEYITSFENSVSGATIATRRQYHQGFPAVGVLHQTTTRLLTGSTYDPRACLKSSPFSICHSFGGEIFPPLGGTVINKATTYWNIYPDFVASQQNPMQLRPYGTELETFDPVSGQRISRVSTAINNDAWGNSVQTAVDTYSGTDNTNPVKLETTNVYVNDATNWRLSRMTGSNVTHRRNGSTIARHTVFDYDMTGPATGFLKSERISPNAAANQDMRKEYSLDAYGNRIASFSCSQGIVNCKSTTLDYSPWDVIRVHRYSRVEYDSRGRYVTGTYEPFNTPGQQWDSTVLTEYKTQTVVARDKYGEITHAKDVNGVSVVSQRSPMGRDYWSWVQTTPNATPGDSAQGIDSYKTYRYCGAATNQVLCPVAAKFRERVVTDAAPKRWAYFDSLKRPVMEITQTFNEGITGKDFSAVCKAYDINGRPSFVSDPFFLSAAHLDGEPSFGTTDPCASRSGTSTQYDVLGRPTRIVMSDNSETTTDYVGLTTIIANDLGQTKTEEKNALGELVKTTDHLGHQTHYSYDAGGNLATVKRNAGRGDIVTSMQYDSLGRKIHMVDPDAGEWGYNYYPSGELESQHNGNEGIYRLSRYDYRGRLVWSGTKNRNDQWESVTVTRFDMAPNGVGQAECSWADGSYQYRAWQGDSNKSNYWLECKQYDVMGRATTTTTTIDDSTYNEVVRYDGLSRPHKRMDPTGQWTKTQFTPRGLSVRTCESSDADTDPNCASNVATTYVETLETNARGNVVKEQRGGIAALQVTRTYDDLTGALLRTCAGNNCQIADENLQWDTVGNLQSRDIANKYREEYSYDSLNRLTQSRFARLEGTTYASGSQPISSQQTYDALGNLCSKTVLGYDNIYSYGGASGCGLNGTSGSGQNNLVVSPHAVQLVTNVNSATDTIYSYDSHGNQIFSDYTAAGGDRSIQYTANDQAYQITQGKNVTQFWYAPNNQRYKRVDIFTSTNGNIDPPPPTGPAFAVSPQMSLFSASGLAAPVVAAAAPPGTSQTTRTITIANLEIITAPNGVVTKRRTVAGVMLQETVSNVTVNRYLFHNHLGSVMRIAEDNGNVTWSFDYSPFGERRMPTAYNPNGIGFASTATNRGYTGHEMLDSFSIVHMNGRIYDSALGRFLQADPMVEDPSNGQNFNRYTYVWNNPLAYTDPSGFMSFKQFFRQLVGVFIASYLPGASFWGAAANGALANISSGFIGGVVATGNLRGGLAGAFSSGVMYAGRQGAVEEAVVPVQSNTSNVSGEQTQVFGAALTPSKSFAAECRVSKPNSGVAATVNDELTTMIYAVTKRVATIYSDDLETLDGFRWRVRDQIMLLTESTGFEYVAGMSSSGSKYVAAINSSFSPFVSVPSDVERGGGWTFQRSWTIHSHGLLKAGYRLTDIDYKYIRANEDPKNPFVMSVGQVARTVGGLQTVRNSFSDQDISNGESWLAAPDIMFQTGLTHGYKNQGCDWKSEQMKRPVTK